MLNCMYIIVDCNVTYSKGKTSADFTVLYSILQKCLMTNIDNNRHSYQKATSYHELKVNIQFQPAKVFPFEYFAI